MKKDKTLEVDDLIFDHRTLEGLGNLYNSLVTVPFKRFVDTASNGLFIIYKVYIELNQAENGLLLLTY